MILTCPECSTRYSSKADAIGPNGRTVRCAKCKSTWFVAAETVDPDALALEDNESVVLEPASESVSDSGPVVPVAASAAGGAHVDLRDRADAEKRARRRKVILAIWAVPLLLLAVAAVLAFVFRQEIVNRMPEAATIYQGLGIDVKQAGLDITPPVAELANIDGEDVLVVTTDVRNLNRQAKPMPLLALSLHNRAGEAVAEWFVEGATISGKGVREVITQYPNPPIDAVSLQYRFADEVG